jgi:AcrR family transcriptional regulator
MVHDGRMSTDVNTGEGAAPIDRTGDGVRLGAPRTARDWARLRLTDQILSAARAQLATEGSSGLSLRAIARELGMASSAVYRYFPSRDELLTALIIEAYNGLGEATEVAESTIDRADLKGRFRETCRAVRNWALDHPHQYALIYGSPVPGYKAPTDTVLPATRVSTVMTLILVDGLLGGHIAPEVLDEPLDAPALAAIAPLLSQVPAEVPPGLLVRGVLVLAALYGTVSFELFGQFHNVIDSAPEARAAWFDLLVDRWIDVIGIE